MGNEQVPDVKVTRFIDPLIYPKPSPTWYCSSVINHATWQTTVIIHMAARGRLSVKR